MSELVAEKLEEMVEAIIADVEESALMEAMSEALAGVEAAAEAELANESGYHGSPCHSPSSPSSISPAPPTPSRALAPRDIGEGGEHDLEEAMRMREECERELQEKENTFTEEAIIADVEESALMEAMSEALA